MREKIASLTGEFAKKIKQESVNSGAFLDNYRDIKAAYDHDVASVIDAHYAVVASLAGIKKEEYCMTVTKEELRKVIEDDYAEKASAAFNQYMAEMTAVDINVSVDTFIRIHRELVSRYEEIITSYAREREEALKAVGLKE